MTTQEMRLDAVKKVASTFVRTPHCKAAEDSFDLLMALGLIAGGLCLLICGESGVGKSTLVRWLIRNLKTTRNAQGITRPAVYVEIPTAPTAIGVYEAILKALGDPKPTRGTRTAKKFRVIEMLREQGVKLLVLDELQHVYDRQSERILFDASEAIKDLLIAYPVSVLCAGLVDAERVVDSNEQLTRRHMRTVKLQRFNWGSKRSKCSFMEVLEAFRRSLDAYELPDFQHELVALRFYLGTGGVMDFVFKIFLFAAQIASSKRLNSIGLDVFHDAWRLAFVHGGSVEQPFKLSFDVDSGVEEKIARAMKINAPPPRPVSSKRAKSRLERTGL